MDNVICKAEIEYGNKFLAIAGVRLPVIWIIFCLVFLRIYLTKDIVLQLLISAAAGNSTAAGTTASLKLKELKELLGSGIITQEDFEAKKQDLLSKM